MSLRKEGYELLMKWGTCALLAIGIFLHVLPYPFNRTLWIDEAMLANSIATRSFAELCASPLDFGQSAPAGYMYLAKISTMIFGMHEFSLRVISLLSFFVALYLFYWILRNGFSANRSGMFAGIFSVISTYIYYSNEFKPYMMDLMLTLSVVAIFILYLQKKINVCLLSICYAIIIWFSLGAIFLLEAPCASFFIEKFGKKSIFLL